jgi:transposase
VKGKTTDVMHEQVAGLDVHKKTIVVCVRIMAGRKAHREWRTFDTTTIGLEPLLTRYVRTDGGRCGAIKNIPGRNTDMNDAMWIADPLAGWSRRASFRNIENYGRCCAPASS